MFVNLPSYLRLTLNAVSLCSSRILWSQAPAPAPAPAASGNSSGSSRSRSSDQWEVGYTPADAQRYREEREEIKRELEVISKQAGIAELEWEHQRRQLLETIDGKLSQLSNHPSILNITDRCLLITHPARDVELDRLKALAERLANKVNTPGDMPVAHLGVVVNRVDEVALHGVRFGTSLGLAAMETHTRLDYSKEPRGFNGGLAEDIDEIEVIVDRLDGHGATIAERISPQSVLNRMFD